MPIYQGMQDLVSCKLTAAAYYHVHDEEYDAHCKHFYLYFAGRMPVTKVE